MTPRIATVLVVLSLGHTACTDDHGSRDDDANWNATGAQLPDGEPQTLTVPSVEYPTIQSAIIDAKHGDTVLVAKGLYPEHIDFLGKGITVKSESGAGWTRLAPFENDMPGIGQSIVEA